VVTLTPVAADEVRRCQREEPDGKFVRVWVDANNSWVIGLDAATNADDETCQSEGVTVIIARDSAAKLPSRLRVDFVDDGGRRGFKLTAERAANVITAATLPEARKGFQTKLAVREKSDEPVEQPPPELFQVVKYKSSVGDLAAYLTPDPKDGKKRPAIVWITGGDCNTIGDVWSPSPPANDQTAAAYRQAGLVMLFPSLRGGNQNPGVREGFLGEVDDVLAATDFLRKQPHVDPDRVYLGGHSTGGTLVLLVAAASDKYRGVFSFGPVGNPAGYGGAFVYCHPNDAREMELRSPERWVNTIQVPTFVFEGTVGGNVAALREMATASANGNVRYLPVKGANHFDVLAPVNKLIAGRILTDTGEKANLAFTESELAGLFKAK
jgi:dipeptidyl aminopeptidase/acylaminoacyl peptidase